MLDGTMSVAPRARFGIADVRDVADLHIRAMTSPDAGGQRFIAAANFAWMADLAAVLKANLGAEAAKVPTRKVPDFVLRLAALFDKDLGAVTGGLGQKHDFSSAKAKDMLGWRPRPLNDTVLDCARSLVANGLV
jgi:nucleoside-diphosphate-sugar epimerase